MHRILPLFLLDYFIMQIDGAFERVNLCYSFLFLHHTKYIVCDKS